MDLCFSEIVVLCNCFITNNIYRNPVVKPYLVLRMCLLATCGTNAHEVSDGVRFPKAT